MNFCTYCNKEFISLNKHLDLKEHKRNVYKENAKRIPKEKGNKGNTLWPLCNVRVKDLYRHYFSALHRYNVRKDAIPFRKYSIEEFKTHFETCPDVRQIAIIKDKKEDDPFWITAKEQLSISDYNKLRRSIYENQKPRRKSRIKPRRKPRAKPRRRTSKN